MFCPRCPIRKTSARYNLVVIHVETKWKIRPPPSTRPASTQKVAPMSILMLRIYTFACGPVGPKVRVTKRTFVHAARVPPLLGQQLPVPQYLIKCRFYLRDNQPNQSRDQTVRILRISSLRHPDPVCASLLSIPMDRVAIRSRSQGQEAYGGILAIYKGSGLD
jgi:hypothetical protein